MLSIELAPVLEEEEEKTDLVGLRTVYAAIFVATDGVIASLTGTERGYKIRKFTAEKPNSINKLILFGKTSTEIRNFQ